MNRGTIRNDETTPTVTARGVVSPKSGRFPLEIRGPPRAVCPGRSSAVCGQNCHPATRWPRFLLSSDVIRKPTVSLFVIPRDRQFSTVGRDCQRVENRPSASVLTRRTPRSAASRVGLKLLRPRRWPGALDTLGPNAEPANARRRSRNRHGSVSAVSPVGSQTAKTSI